MTVVRRYHQCALVMQLLRHVAAVWSADRWRTFFGKHAGSKFTRRWKISGLVGSGSRFLIERAAGRLLRSEQPPLPYHLGEVSCRSTPFTSCLFDPRP